MRLYRLLLRLYPASFRASYGDELRAVFAARRRDANGPLAGAALWFEIIVDTMLIAARLHLDTLWQDLRHTVRSLRRSPGFTITAIVVASLGIGATTATFSIADHVIRRPFPFPDSDRLVKVWQDQTFRGYATMEFSPGNYRDVKTGMTSFEAMGAYRDNLLVTLTGNGEPALLEGSALTPEMFDVLGMKPLMGRVFDASDARADGPNVLLISETIWRTRFAADPRILERQLRLDGDLYQVVGVMPRAFAFPTRTREFWMVHAFQPGDFDNRGDTHLYSIAKLRRGVTVEQARAEGRTIAPVLARAAPVDNDRTGVTIYIWREDVPRQARQLLVALVGAAACVLLIACTNLASLLIARAGTREHEFDVRAALGAGRGRLVRQLLTESVVLAAISGVTGVALAVFVLPLVSRLVPTALPIAEVPGVDARMLLLAASLSLVTALGFGVLPALRAGRRAGGGSLVATSRTGVSRRTERVRRVLVVVQVSVSVVLLVSAGLLLRALSNVRATPPGFDAAGVLTLRTPLPIPAYATVEARTQFYDRVITDIRAIPGVADAGYISALPMVWRGGIWPVTVLGQDAGTPDQQASSLRFITPGFFRALSVATVAGRTFSDRDTIDMPAVAVVSQSFAQHYFPNGNAVGGRFNIGNRDREIVGIVGDVRVRGLERVSEPQVYLPAAQHGRGVGVFYISKDLVVKSSLPPASLEPQLRQIISRADSTLPISNVRMLTDVVVGETATRDVQLRVLGAFAAIALLLAGVGIHGLLGFYVSTRAREIGLRVALGAQRRDVVSLVTRQTMMLAAIGLAGGVALAWLVARSLGAVLAGVAPADAVTFLAASATCVVMMALGSALPIRRALKLDPVRLIRMD